MSTARTRYGSARVTATWPALLLMLLSLLTVVWLSPDLPYPQQDSAWVLALNQAVADRLVFGRDVLFTLGPWGNVYAGQYHPATDGMMLAGGTIVALALAGGLATLAIGRRRWLALFVPVLIATVGQRDPVFVATPMLLLSVAVALAQPTIGVPAIPRGTWQTIAMLLLTVNCALLNLIKGTFGTLAIPMVGLAVLVLLVSRLFRLAGLMLAFYAAGLIGFWILAGQRLIDLPRYFLSIPIVISGYAEGLALSNHWSDIPAYLCASVVLVWLVWRCRAQERLSGTVLLLTGLLLTLFIAFKSGFVRHDEHALIAAGTLALMPFMLINTLRIRPLAVTMLVTLSALTFISHHYAGYEWPSLTRGRDRWALAASGAWTRITDPGRLPRLFRAEMGAVRAGMPLPHVAGPTDIYSSGQMILLANGLEWSPRPALQSVTVFSEALEKADLNHLEGTDGRNGPVQNVFYRVENEDNRLRSTQDGLSWPALLSEFRVTSYDRALDTVLLQRQAVAHASVPAGPPLLDNTFRLGEDVTLPALPTGLAWAKLDIEPTLAGRLASTLFRPPLLTMTIRYANGPVERFRLVSGTAHAGFLLTPPVMNTEDMLWLLLPDRRVSAYRPVSITVTGESGTRWLWEPHFTLNLQSIQIPTQDHVRVMLTAAPLTLLPDRPNDVGFADACAIELVNGNAPAAHASAVQGTTEVSGWIIGALAKGEPPDRVVVRLNDAAGQVWETIAEPRYRLDVAGYFNNPALVRSGFDARFDVSSLSGRYTLTVEGDWGQTSWRCKQTQDLLVSSP